MPGDDDGEAKRQRRELALIGLAGAGLVAVAFARLSFSSKRSN